MSPSCCKGKQGGLGLDSCATTSSTSIEVPPIAISLQEVEGNHCTGNQAEDAIQNEVQKSSRFVERRASSCVECTDSLTPGQACCDESCMLRIAVRECDNSRGVGDDISTISVCSKNPDKRSACCGETTKAAKTKKGPCKNHLQSVKSRFQPTLDALGCICRALLALNLESCCEEGQNARRKPRQSSDKTDPPACSSSTSPKFVKGGDCCSVVSPDANKEPIATDCKKSCCGTTPPKSSCDKSKSEAISASPAKTCCGEKSKPLESDCKKGCCDTLLTSSYGNPEHKISSFSCAKKCCSETSTPAEGDCKTKSFSRDPQPTALSNSCTKKCCSESSKSVMIERASDDGCPGGSCSEDRVIPKLVAFKVHLDLEKGSLGDEHVALTIQGMTCTGCETKLERTLANIAGVSMIKTSLVLARAEFDVSTAQISIDEVVTRLRKATGFECQKLTQDGHELEIMMTSIPAKLLEQYPPGVLSISVTPDASLKISYDPQIIGARDIVEKIFDEQPELAPNRADPSISAGNKHIWEVGLKTLLSACLTIPVLILAWAPLPERDIVYGSVSLVLATIIQMFIAGPFYVAALKSLIFARVIEMDLLVVLSTSTAYVFSVIAFALLVAGKPLSTGEFFETSTLLVTLIMLGRFITALARQKAIESITIRSLQQSTATLVGEDGSSTRNIDVRLLQYGDIFRVMPEERVVTDGTIIVGNSEIDESMITGESSLVMKTKGTLAIAGSVNGSGTLDIRLTRLCDDNTISNIANMIDEAKLSKPKTQEMADRVAGYFVPVIMAITIITFLIWIAIGINIQKKTGSNATVQAVTYAVAVLIISCPCAIGLAVPMVIVIAGGVAADKGVIFKSADTIEAAKNVTHVVFDKTGTLTSGRLSVEKSCYVDELKGDVKPILLGLVSGINHPVSKAITGYLESLDVSPVNVLDVKSLPGKGVIGMWNGNEVRAGNPFWTETISSPKLQEFLASGSTVLCFTVNHHLRSVYSLRDSLRPEAAEVVSILHGKGVSVSIVSGDEVGAVQRTAESLGISSSNALSRCSPIDKQDYIKRLKNSCTNSTIIFLGDGTNDAIALASADIGIHMSEGTDVARSAADAVMTLADLRGILVLIELSRKVLRRIVFNFAWSFVYNLFAILLAAGAFVNFRIPPAFAGLGEIASVLPVIVIAVGLRWARF